MSHEDGLSWTVIVFTGIEVLGAIFSEALTEAFGQQYRSYMHQTKRLIPFIY